MIGSFKTTFFLIGIAALWAGAGSATPLPPLDFKQLIDSSDVICIGAVESVRDLGKVTRQNGNQTIEFERKGAIVKCQRVLKGQITTSELLTVEFLDSKQFLLGSAVLSAGETAMLFLAKAETNYQMASPYYGKQVAVASPVNEDQSIPVINKIEREFLNVVSKGSDAEASTALDRLFKLDSRALVAESNRVMEAVSKRPEREEAVAVTVLALRIKDGDFEALLQVPKLSSNVTDRDSYLPWQDNLLTAIDQIHDEKAVPVLNKLLVSKSPAVRREASRALATLANRSSVPYLVKGLQDSDVDTSYNSLIALSRITGKPGPGREEFERNREKYVLEWKTP
jgi:hypothetical protein